MGLAQIKMPQLGESVTEGTVDKWLKHEGDFVKRDEPLVEIVTDKVNAEIPSPFEGKLVKIDVTEGETVLVGAVLAQIEVASAAGAAAASTPAKAARAAEAGGTAPAVTAVGAPVQAGDGDRARLSPAVRKLAAENGIDAAALRGSGWEAASLAMTCWQRWRMASRRASLPPRRQHLPRPRRLRRQARRNRPESTASARSSSSSV
ncbi:MAG: hypothetical protein PVS2B1_11950 [Candidatus Dormibacteraceae bacterium]